jgi:hypothetical protein
MIMETNLVIFLLLPAGMIGQPLLPLVFGRQKTKGDADRQSE